MVELAFLTLNGKTTSHIFVITPQISLLIGLVRQLTEVLMIFLKTFQEIYNILEQALRIAASFS